LSRLDRALARVPAALAHKSHILFLIGLGTWLVLVPVIPGTDAIRPSAFAELIGGNWTNIASALGASIAAGAALATERHARHNRKNIQRIHDHHFPEDAE
jgi:hypothetical protein